MYINSYNQTAESREEVLFEISHYDIRASAFTFSAAVDDFITDQADQSAQASQFRLARYFHELSTEQQENYRANVKKYKRKKSKSSKSLRECSR
jgi:type IV secretory pathway VirB9-like protein